MDAQWSKLEQLQDHIVQASHKFLFLDVNKLDGSYKLMGDDSYQVGWGGTVAANSVKVLSPAVTLRVNVPLQNAGAIQIVGHDKLVQWPARYDLNLYKSGVLVKRLADVQQTNVTHVELLNPAVVLDAIEITIYEMSAAYITPKLMEFTVSTFVDSSDSSTLSLAETKTLQATIPSVDVIPVRVDETRQITAQGELFETWGLSLVESPFITNILDNSDTSNVEMSDAGFLEAQIPENASASISIGEADTLTATIPDTDTSTVGLSEDNQGVQNQSFADDSNTISTTEVPYIGNASEASDSGIVQLTETPELEVNVLRTVPVNISLDEAQEVTATFSNSITTSVSIQDVGALYNHSTSFDTAVLSITETSALGAYLFNSEELLVTPDYAIIFTKPTSDTLELAIDEWTNLANIHLTLKQHVRTVYAKLRVRYTSLDLDSSVKAISNIPVAYGSDISNLYNGNRVSTHKYAYLNEDALNVDLHPMKLNAVDNPVVFRTMSNSEGVLSEPLNITITFSTRPLPQVICIGDNSHNNFPVNFTIKAYHEDTLIYSRDVQENQQLEWLDNAALEACTRVEYVITKISKPNTSPKIQELFGAVVEEYESEDLISLDLLEEVCPEVLSVPVGQVSANELTAALYNNGRFSNSNLEDVVLKGLIKANREVKLWFGADVGKIREWIEMGTFFSGPWTTNRHTLEATFTARDRLSLLTNEHHLTTMENTDARQVAIAILEDAGLDPVYMVVDPELANIKFPVVSFERLSHIEALKQLANTCLLNIYTDRFGRVVVAKRVSQAELDLNREFASAPLILPGTPDSVYTLKTLSGCTLQNLIKNGNFNTNAVGWFPSSSIATVSNNTLVITGNGVDNTPRASYEGVKLYTINHKYFVKALARVTTDSCVRLIHRAFGASPADTTIENPVKNTWYTMSNLFTMISEPTSVQYFGHAYKDALIATDKVMELKKVVSIDLTAMFGAGKEPTKEWCDANITFFEDIRSVAESGESLEIVSCGKNLFNNDNSLLKKGVYFSATGEYTSEANSLLSEFYIEIDSSKNYVWNGENKSIIIMTYDTGKNALERLITYSSPIINTIKFKENVKYIRIASYQRGFEVLDTFQLEEGITATIPEPYKEQKQPISLTESLRSLPNVVKDVVDFKRDVIVKNVGKVVLNSNMPIGLINSSMENTIKFSVEGVTNIKYTNIYYLICDKFTSGVNIITSDTEGIRTASTSSAFYISIAKSKLTTPDVAGFKAWLQANPITVYYQLDTPIEEPIDVEQYMKQFKNGHLQIQGSLISPELDYASNAYGCTLRFDPVQEGTKYKCTLRTSGATALDMYYYDSNYNVISSEVLPLTDDSVTFITPGLCKYWRYEILGPLEKPLQAYLENIAVHIEREPKELEQLLGPPQTTYLEGDIEDEEIVVDQRQLVNDITLKMYKASKELNAVLLEADNHIWLQPLEELQYILPFKTGHYTSDLNLVLPQITGVEITLTTVSSWGVLLHLKNTTQKPADVTGITATGTVYTFASYGMDIRYTRDMSILTIGRQPWKHDNYLIQTPEVAQQLAEDVFYLHCDQRPQVKLPCRGDFAVDLGHNVLIKDPTAADGFAIAKQERATHYWDGTYRNEVSLKYERSV